MPSLYTLYVVDLYASGVVSGTTIVIVVGIDDSSHSAYNVISVTSGEGNTLSSNTLLAKSHLSE